MDKEKIKMFISALNAYHKDNECVYFGHDSTNMNPSSLGIESTSYEHAKVDEDLPLVNLSYALKQDDFMS